MNQMREHHYATTVTWTGNLGTGTSGYKDFSRDHRIAIHGKPAIQGSADPAFRGDPSRHNPEDMLVASLSACHMLWFLHLCAVNGVVVVNYQDEATGTMAEGGDGGGRFTDVTLRPSVTLAPGGDPDTANHLHHEAHAKCFIANSVNFPVRCEPATTVIA